MKAHQWRVVANFMHMKLIGGEGCVIAAFDERTPATVDLLERSEPDA